MIFSIEKILHHYAVCALWSSSDENGEPLDAAYDVSDISEETLEEMREDIIDFLSDNYDILVQSGQSEEQIGHDFWLTRNRHGAGFWDRGLGEIGNQLTEASRVYGSCGMYVGSGGKLYI